MIKILGLATAFTFLMGASVYAYHKPISAEREPFEKMYFEYGYKTIEEALSECNSHFNKKIKLPYRLPPIPFTHQFARCYQQGDVNDHFEVEYLYESKGDFHYMIRVNPAKNMKHKFPRKSDTIHTYDLQNRAVAVYGTTPSVGNRMPFFNVLSFELDGWHYILSIDKRIKRRVTEDVLVEIANSIR